MARSAEQWRAIFKSLSHRKNIHPQLFGHTGSGRIRRVAEGRWSIAQELRGARKMQSGEMVDPHVIARHKSSRGRITTPKQEWPVRSSRVSKKDFFDERGQKVFGKIANDPGVFSSPTFSRVIRPSRKRFGNWREYSPDNFNPKQLDFTDIKVDSTKYKHPVHIPKTGKKRAMIELREGFNYGRNMKNVEGFDPTARKALSNIYHKHHSEWGSIRWLVRGYGQRSLAEKGLINEKPKPLPSDSRLTQNRIRVQTKQRNRRKSRGQ